jgi:hypothetical protein
MATLKKKRQKRGAPGGTGAGVDAMGGPVFDPTENVLDLVEKETGRQDDLRDWIVKYYDMKLDDMEEMAILRDTHQKEVAVLRDMHARELRESDNTNSATAIGEIRSAAKELATVATSTASTLQSRVDATAATLGKAGAEQVGAVLTRVAALELAAAQGIGKQAVVDPMMATLLDEVKKLSGSGERREGKSSGINATIAVIITVVGFVGTSIGAILGALALRAFLK